jgi:DNA-3-methyladenine glycosylase I
VAREFGSFNDYLWHFTEGRTVVTRPRPETTDDIPANSALSRTFSRDLQQRGFRFVGPTICHSYLQATGVLDEHMRGCFRATENDRKAAE